VLNNKKIAFYVFYVGLFGLSASIPVSKFGTSVGMFLLSFAWFLEWNWKDKLLLYKQNKLLLILSTGLFLIFVFGLVHSENMDYAMKDLKIKAPLFIIPVVFGLSSIKIDRKKIITSLILVSASGITASIIGFISYSIQTGQGEVLNLRAMSPFISMIRLSLILCFAFGFVLWGLNVIRYKYKWLLIIPNIWIVYFVIISESLTGIILLPIISIYFLFFILKRDFKFAISLLILLIGCASWVGIELNKISSLVLSNHKSILVEYTLNGRKYNHNTDVLFRENGHLIYDNFCEEEMEREWNKKSKKQYSQSFNNYKFSSVLIRYLSSRGLSKDSVGVSKLSDIEIEAIQNGITNVYYIDRNPLFKRFHVGIMELRDAFEHNRHTGRSIASRFIYAATGYEIFKDNFWFGVGIGDVKDAFIKEYKKSSTLEEGCDKKSHNQFITTALSLGVFGLVAFVGILILLIKKYAGTLKYLFFLGQIIVLFSMLWEDTLETQAGVALFSLLLNVFIFENKLKKTPPVL
tara:strand:- start:1395 stop:2954 length:1560 start_codon:yes stop_codon:yes gene_type:complete